MLTNHPMLEFDKDGKPILTKAAVFAILSTDLSKAIAQTLNRRSAAIMDAGVSPGEFMEVLTVVTLSVFSGNQLIDCSTKATHEEALRELSTHIASGFAAYIHAFNETHPNPPQP